MNDEEFVKSALFEHRFWLQILADHSRFLYMALSPNEDKAIKKADQFIRSFDQLLQIAEQPLSLKELNDLNHQAYYLSQNLRNFKLYIEKKKILGEINIDFTPTFINHLVNELEVYLRILGHLLQNKPLKLLNPVHYHLVWLLDSIEHAATIKSYLDFVESNLISKSGEFVRQFRDYYIKAVEMNGYMRTNLKQFPALHRFNEQTKREIILFHTFIKDLEELVDHKEVLGSLMPLMLNHMSREECYYLNKLAQSANLEIPDCML